MAARTGNREALSGLLEETARFLLPRALTLTRDRAEADRLVEDALTRIFERLPQLQHQDAFWSWSRQVLLRLYLDDRRRLLRRPVYRIESVEAVTEMPHQAVELREALDRLPRVDRALLVLHYWDGLTLVECGRAFALPTGTVKSRLSAALTKLRTLLRENP